MHIYSLSWMKAQYVIINIKRGLYTYNHLPLGVSSSPNIFQRVIEGILQRIPHWGRSCSNWRTMGYASSGRNAPSKRIKSFIWDIWLTGMGSATLLISKSQLKLSLHLRPWGPIGVGVLPSRLLSNALNIFYSHHMLGDPVRGVLSHQMPDGTKSRRGLYPGPELTLIHHHYKPQASAADGVQR